MITSLAQFKLKADELARDGRIQDMYDVFEYDTSDDVRAQVYDLADDDTTEPFRSAMITMGFANY